MRTYQPAQVRSAHLLHADEAVAPSCASPASCDTLLLAAAGDSGIGRIGERGKKKSAVKRYKATIPYFRAFCVAEGRAVADAPVLIEGSGPSAVPRADVCGAFLRWLGELARTDAPAICGDGDTRKITAEIFDKAKDWVMHTVKMQLSEQGATSVVRGWAGALPGAEEAWSFVKERARMLKVADCTEGDARADLILTFKQMVAAAHHVLAAMSGKPLQWLQTGFAFRGSMAMANRGENYRDLMLSHAFPTEYDAGEPFADESTGLHFKNIRNKTEGSSGAPQYTGLLPHRNPLFCAIGLLGHSLLYRFLVMREPFPDVSNPSSFCRLSILRATSASKGIVGVSESAFREMMEGMLEAADVERVPNDAVSHLGRHQAQIEAQKARVPEPSIEKACNYNLGERENTTRSSCRPTGSSSEPAIR